MRIGINMKGLPARARALLVFSTLFLLIPGCSSTPPREQSSDALRRAETAYRAGDYARVRRLLTPPAKTGDAHAQYVLGYMNFYGQGAPANERLARAWFHRSAAQGFPKAEIALNRISMAATVRGTSAPASSGGDSSAPPAQEEDGNWTAAGSAAPLSHPPGSSVNAPPMTPQGDAAPPQSERITPGTAKTDAPGKSSEARSGLRKPKTITSRTTRNAPETVSAGLSTLGVAPPAQEAHNERWVRSQKPGHYTIQLAAIASNQPDGAISFIMRHKLAHRAAECHVRRAGRRGGGSGDGEGCVSGVKTPVSRARCR